MNRKKFFLGLIVFEIFLLLVYVFSFSSISPALLPPDPISISAQSFFYKYLITQRLDYNSGYFVSSSMNQFLSISNAFKNLPIPPNDFFKSIQLFSKEYGSAVNLLPKYYLQPEFLPNFYENFFTHYQTSNPSHFFIQGLGVLPFEQFISLKRGE